jgi:amidase
MTDIAFASASDLAGQLRRREIGALELLDHYIGRVEALDGRTNAVVVRDFERARTEAAEADAALARGEAKGPLHGLPMTIKESFQLAGLPTTFGYLEYKANVATTDALVVQRLKRAGAVIFGKTNVPPGLMDGQSWNEVYGRTNNPWDLERTPGGSSGGSAAALAAGLTALELGSDIASSVRNPAHFCGVFGHKPTWGLVPQRGHALIDLLGDTDIAVIGPLARSAADLELELSVVAGPDEPEAQGLSLALKPARQAALRDFRVALVLDDPVAEVDQPVQDRLRALGQHLEREGAVVDWRARPAFDSRDYYFHYMMLLRAATAGGASDEDFARDLQAAEGAGLSTREIGPANAFGATMSHRDWLRLDERRRRYRNAWRAFFEGYDLLLCPVLSSAAFPHSEVPPQQRTLEVNGKPAPFENQLFWAGYAGLAHLPASVAPIGLTDQGLPVGVQIIGPPYGDLTCLRMAALLEQGYRAFEPPPGFA